MIRYKESFIYVCACVFDKACFIAYNVNNFRNITRAAEKNVHLVSVG